ncbi:hypothetical protein D0Y65_023592 [Glycine soja]|uniref:Uncharacterized protein n=1 Tax=Glycine soja TaxID=3848 RepID=A0A445IYP9_GLYSO|nr:hypothetical protein D0Y65_023592 [Glycine soja]
MEHESNRQLIPPSSLDKSNIVGAPRSNPQIGFEYQMEVTSMIKESKWLKLLMNTTDSVHTEVEDNVANLNNSWSDADVKSFLLGDHYFDSVNDVLSKVIAEPNLLKLEVVETKVGGSNGEDAETGSNKDGQPDNHHHHYLKHQASTNNGDHIMYAIFYIGLMHRGKPCNLSELKSLHGNSVGKVDVDDDDIAYNKGNMHISKTKHRKGKHNKDATTQKEVNANPDHANNTTENHENQKTCVPDGNQPKRINLVKEQDQVIQLLQLLLPNDKDSLLRLRLRQATLLRTPQEA